ncbi:hypothetical protein [Rhodobacter maris]|uniref:Uncharacterized protein n=1 Tax=Rhodobacter maris TaxID=446682 RepID=A0A285TIV5_9RHOB|nr:hypothetical protein [Rhodobacter maris]SOC21952.1 hypothetical protein SAMN05877831_1264 [Rhodobacter maris]
MAKIALRFTRPHGPFNTGEVAALEESAARALLARGAAEKHSRQPKAALAVAAATDPALKDALAALEKAQADLDHRADELDAREAELLAREAEVAQREADQEEDWSPIEMPEEEADDEKGEGTGAAGAEDTGLPKQGK